MDLAKKVGLSQSTIAEAEYTAEGSLKTLQIAAVTGVSPRWLATGAGQMIDHGIVAEEEAPRYLDAPKGTTPPKSVSEVDLTDNPEYPAIRRVRFKLSAGASGFGIEYLDEPDEAPIVFRRSWFESHGYRPHRLFAFRVANGSMESGLYDGDTVVVNADATTPKDGVVYAFNYEGELVVKRLIRDSGQWWLYSDNPDQRRYPPKLCDENCHIIGQIVHKQSERI